MPHLMFYIRLLLFCLLMALCFSSYFQLTTTVDDQWIAEQLRRKEIIQNVCLNYSGEKSIEMRNFGWLVASEKNLFYCLNPKVGTSTYISTTFMQLSEMRKVN